MVIIQMNYAKLSLKLQYFRLLYPLLSLVKADCTPDDVEWALDEAMDEVVRMKQKLQGQQQQIQQQEEEKRETKEKIARFLKELKDADIPRHKALRALDAVGPDDPDEGRLIYSTLFVCIFWCSFPSHFIFQDSFASVLQLHFNVDEKFT